MADWFTKRVAEGLKDKVWKTEIDNGIQMLKCPYCKCRMQKKHYIFAVGSNGFRYCPYCGKDMRKDGQTSIQDFIGGN